jgi:hypothetical protein
MSKIYACELVPANYPPIEPVEAPIPFENCEHFEKWLRERYIPRTLTVKIVPLQNSEYDIDINKTECWAIFSDDEIFERCCQVYARTPLTPEFQENLRGKIFVHNHFSDDSTLSTGEVVAWADLHMEEFRAVAPSRSYSIKPKNRKWPNPHQLLQFFSEHPELNNGLLRHRCYELLAKKGLFEYVVTQVNEA